MEEKEWRSFSFGYCMRKVPSTWFYVGRTNKLISCCSRAWIVLRCWNKSFHCVSVFCVVLWQLSEWISHFGLSCIFVLPTCPSDTPSLLSPFSLLRAIRFFDHLYFLLSVCLNIYSSRNWLGLCFMCIVLIEIHTNWYFPSKAYSIPVRPTLSCFFKLRL